VKKARGGDFSPPVSRRPCGDYFFFFFAAFLVAFFIGMS